MDIEFIELEHRENVMKLMEICGIDMKEAYDLYIDSGYNFEAAVNRKFNPIPVATTYPEYPPQFVPVAPELNFLEQLPILQNQFSEDDDYKYSEYKKFMKNGQPFDKKYPVRKHEGLLDRILPTFFKGEPEDPFKKCLEKQVGRRINLKNTVGNLSEALEWSWKEKYPVLVMVLDFTQELTPYLRRIFSDDNFVEQTLNQQFKLFGLNAFEYVMQDQLKVFFNLERDLNNIIVCRVNYIDEVHIMQRIEISESLDEIKRKLKLAKSECIQLEIEEKGVINQYQEERKGNFSYKRPKTIKENLKLKEDRKIRKQQEEEFYKACLPKQEQKIQNNGSLPKQVEKKQSINTELKTSKPEPKKQVISPQALRKIRQEKFSKLKQYKSGLSFKIRVPSGQNIIINVEGEEKVQYLFDYISFEPNDLGFTEDSERRFDIFVGFGGSEKLKGKEGEKLKSLFEDSEVLIVREASQ